MSITKAPRKALLGALLALVLVVGATFSFSPAARADAVVFLTRLNGVIATYPNTNAFSVGTSTSNATGNGTAKLGVTLTQVDTFAKGFAVSSTTATGAATTTSNLFSVGRGGCIQLTSTSSATQLKLVLDIAGATSTHKATVYADYGTCSP